MEKGPACPADGVLGSRIHGDGEGPLRLVPQQGLLVVWFSVASGTHVRQTKTCSKRAQKCAQKLLKVTNPIHSCSILTLVWSDLRTSGEIVVT